ncbi:hypothetical protein Pint_31674 [Pistacia integerrima]|uniref:Uncharacterized protein n=1 Tax=Pistacia integerrima TaxID=434235 RepID=A0ACC0XPZ5_9ROSI|nr:hypothetical protein Pint_31674 [Pistacia integerrima]
MLLPTAQLIEDSNASGNSKDQGADLLMFPSSSYPRPSSLITWTWIHSTIVFASYLQSKILENILENPALALELSKRLRSAGVRDSLDELMASVPSKVSVVWVNT